MVNQSTPSSRFSMQLQHACTRDEVASAYLDSAGELLKADTFALYQLDPTTGRPSDCAARAPDHFLDEYEEYGRDDDPVLRGAVATSAPVDEAIASSSDEWRSSGAYAALSRAGYAHSLEAPVLLGDATIATLNFARGADEEPFGPRERRRARWASQLVSAALFRAARFEETSERAELLTDVIEALDTGLVVSTLDGAQLYTNDAAERRVGDGQRSLLTLAEPAVTENLQQLRHGSDRSITNTHPLQDEAQPHGRATARSIRLDSSSGMVLSFLDFDDPGVRQPSNPNLEALSARELEIAELVARGLTTGQISSELFISQNTVKQHLKRMFQKIHVHNRAQLVAALWNPEDEAGQAPSH